MLPRFHGSSSHSIRRCARPGPAAAGATGPLGPTNAQRPIAQLSPGASRGSQTGITHAPRTARHAWLRGRGRPTTAPPGPTPAARQRPAGDRSARARSRWARCPAPRTGVARSAPPVNFIIPLPPMPLVGRSIQGEGPTANSTCIGRSSRFSIGSGSPGRCPPVPG